MSAFHEATVFRKSWKCGDVLTPGTFVNVITPTAGQQAVARVSASQYHEKFYEEAAKSGLFPMGAQHGVCSHRGLFVISLTVCRESVPLEAGPKVAVTIHSLASMA